ncbi:nucleoside-diphosphate sugar epimerase [Epidermidibacterium keratini]|uniref:Nucleoside-diphosphate sugar epimerase n=1 Tax=Epidermidibacterium keratini TaxID=1891644 RepID=A0A7L4YL31_9ACTN|nr:nucleoside-diphosphate sugar epimerase [Epidermidibacterium keratini]QHB99538.1 nucleoside-diphosphate sugar epimerase [Epidermidibacterium keratini]
MTTRTILVTGARGKTGREVLRQLSTQRDVEVIAGSSRPELVLRANSVRPVAFDWNVPATWEVAAARADAIYLMRPDLPNAAALTSGLIALRPDAHIVLLSEQSAEMDAHDGWVRGVEEAVAATRASWTILRPSWFHQDLTDPRHFLASIQSHDKLVMPSGGAPIAWVDARDIAAVAMSALLDPETHRGHRHAITGPEGVTLQEVAKRVSAASGTAITAVDQPLSEVLDGLDSWIAEVLESLYTRVQSGGFGELTDTVQAITGAKPRSLETFIRENRAEWTPHVVKDGR